MSQYQASRVRREQVEFPSRWQSAFQDVIGLLADGEGTADMFCRVLTAVDEDIISLEIPRSAPLKNNRNLNFYVVTFASFIAI